MKISVNVTSSKEDCESFENVHSIGFNVNGDLELRTKTKRIIAVFKTWTYWRETGRDEGDEEVMIGDYCPSNLRTFATSSEPHVLDEALANRLNQIDKSLKGIELKNAIDRIVREYMNEAKQQ